MQARLREYECLHCGHFISATAAPSTTETPPPSGSSAGFQRKTIPLVLDTPQPAPARLSNAKPYDPRPLRLGREKVVYLITFAVVEAAGTSLLFLPQPGLRRIIALCAGALVLTLALGFLLHTDWQSLQQLAAVAALALAAYFGWSVYAGWQDSSVLVKVKVCADTALMLWLAVLFWRSSSIAD